nr:retrovirus-related Pol polyprotein from transposon TNT 1-94 [Tanacetum cinerariifolium]
VKTKLALLEASPLSTQSPKPFQYKNKGLVAETFDCDEEEMSNDKEMTQVKVLMALVDDKLVVVKNHARNGKWINIIMRKAVNDCLKLIEVPTDPKSSKESGSEPLTPLPPLKVLQGCNTPKMGRSGN